MARECVKHKMIDGTIMDGPIHGPGQSCVEWKDTMKRGGRTRPRPRKKSAGGMLIGPTHEQGGIPAIVDGIEPIELEGGEFVINAQTTAALGEDFLHKLNSTETTHHQGGFNSGDLPTPSQYQLGGRVDYKIKQMRAGGKIKKTSINSKKLQTGGVVTTPPTGKNNSNFRVKRKLEQIRGVRKRIGRGTTRITGISRKHTHTAEIDSNGNGVTFGGDHTHNVIANKVQMTCPGRIPCHSHEL